MQGRHSSGPAPHRGSPLGVDARHGLDAAPVVRGRLHRAGHKAQQVAGQRVLAADDEALGACG